MPGNFRFVQEDERELSVIRVVDTALPTVIRAIEIATGEMNLGDDGQHLARPLDELLSCLREIRGRLQEIYGVLS